MKCARRADGRPSQTVCGSPAWGRRCKSGVWEEVRLLHVGGGATPVGGGGSPACAVLPARSALQT